MRACLFVKVCERVGTELCLMVWSLGLRIPIYDISCHRLQYSHIASLIVIPVTVSVAIILLLKAPAHCSPGRHYWTLLQRETANDRTCLISSDFIYLRVWAVYFHTQGMTKALKCLVQE